MEWEQQTKDKLVHNIKILQENLDTSLKNQQQLANYKLALDEHSIVAITNPKGVITSINPAFCRISQYNADELIGKTHKIINSAYHEPAFFSEMWQQITSGQVWRGDIRNRKKDGSYYWVQTTIVPFVDGNQKICQYAAIRTDITDKMELSEKLKAANNRLKNITSELNTEKTALNRKNIALNELISHIEEDKNRIKHIMANNLETIKWI